MNGRPAFLDTDDVLPCQTTDPEVFFSDYRGDINGAKKTSLAKALCQACPVRAACLVWAVNNLSHGYAGGMTPAQRNRLRASNFGAAA